MIRCREIGIADLEAVADLLTRGFARHRSRDWWIAGLRRLSVREVPEGFPRFGYMLDHEGTPVGALLLVYTERDDGGGTSIRCNLSSWYVEPAYRTYAPMLTNVAQRHKHITYVNISPAHWTWRTIEAQGFRAYCGGLFFSFPALSRLAKGCASKSSSRARMRSTACLKPTSRCLCGTRLAAASVWCAARTTAAATPSSCSRCAYAGSPCWRCG
jgi:hypothetical protein